MTNMLFHDWLEALATELQAAGLTEDGKDYIAQTGIECWHDAWATGDSPKDAAQSEADAAMQLG